MTCLGSHDKEEGFLELKFNAPSWYFGSAAYQNIWIATDTALETS